MTPLIITQSKLICCCGAKTWTKFIACLEILFVLVAVVMRYVLMSMTTEEKEMLPGNENTTEEMREHYEIVMYAYVFAHPTYQLLEGATLIILGIILLVGAHMGKPLLLLIWLVASGLGLLIIFVFLILGIYGLAVGGLNGIFGLVFVIVAFSAFLVKSFFVYVVFVHRRELVILKNQLDSIVHYNAVHVDVIKYNN